MWCDSLAEWSSSSCCISSSFVWSKLNCDNSYFFAVAIFWSAILCSDMLTLGYLSGHFLTSFQTVCWSNSIGGRGQKNICSLRNFEDCQWWPSLAPRTWWRANRMIVGCISTPHYWRITCCDTQRQLQVLFGDHSIWKQCEFFECVFPFVIINNCCGMYIFSYNLFLFSQLNEICFWIVKSIFVTNLTHPTDVGTFKFKWTLIPFVMLQREM